MSEAEELVLSAEALRVRAVNALYDARNAGLVMDSAAAAVASQVLLFLAANQDVWVGSELVLLGMELAPSSRRERERG